MIRMMSKKAFLRCMHSVCPAILLGLMLVLSACEGLPVEAGGVSTPAASAPSSGTTPTQSAATPTATTADATALLNRNLIVNGDAEAGPGTVNSAVIEPIPGWTRHGPANVMLYSTGNSNGLIAPTDPGPADRGKNYFWGGGNNAQNLGSSAVTSLTQNIDISAATALLAQGKGHFTLSAWMGGYMNQDDNAKVTIEFDSATGQALAGASVGPVLAAERHNAFGLVQHFADGAVPAGTTTVKVTITFTRVGGSDNDGSADDIALTLRV